MPACSSKPRIDSGATYAHALVALAVLVAMSAASYPLAATALTALRRATEAAFGASRALAVDASLRALAERVRPPFEARSIDISRSDDTLEAPWLDGERERIAVVSWDGEALWLGESEAAFRIAGLGNVELGWLEDSRARVLGFVAVFEAGGRSWRVEAPFGSFPRPDVEGSR